MESERLAALSTNILTLSKYENLEIISDKVPFRLDEQIRKSIVLMEPKWSAKEIAINVELDQIIYSGNKDLTQQIWLNLLDNAIKFSNHGGSIDIILENVNDEIRLSLKIMALEWTSIRKNIFSISFIKGIPLIPKQEMDLDFHLSNE